MTDADYSWLTNDRIDPPPVIKVEAGSEWHYAQGGWHATDPVPDVTAADIEAEQAAEAEDAPKPRKRNKPAVELAEDEQEPDPETPAKEES
jgi:hypothetical protein